MRRGTNGARWRAALVSVAVLANLALGALYMLAPLEHLRLEPASIQHQTGNTFTVKLPHIAFPFADSTDSMSAPTRSDLQLLEDGRRLGPSHSQHVEIGEQGAGLYSAWSGYLFFSASDNSDPRTNGRSYVAVYHAAVYPGLLLGVALFDLVLLPLTWGAFSRRVRDHARAIVLVIGAAVLLRLAAAAVGLGPAIGSLGSVPKDASLVIAVALHAALGIALFALVIVSGAGAMLWAARRDLPLSDLVLRGFLPGLLLVGCAAVLALAAPFGRWLGSLLLLGASAGLGGWRPGRGEVAGAAAVLGIVLPPALAFAAFMGFLWHGPTETLAASPIGDTTIYVGQAGSLAFELYPYRNLGVEGGNVTFVNQLPPLLANQLPPLLAAVLLRVSWFDPFLFMGVSLTVAFLLWLPLMLTLLVSAVRRDGPDTRLGGLPLAICTGLFIAATDSPSWALASPPYFFMVPVVIACFHAWRRANGRTAGLWEALGVAVVGSAVSKVLSIAALGPFAIVDLGLAARGTNRKLLIGTVIVLALAGVYAVTMLATFLPFVARVFPFGPLSLHAYFSWGIHDPVLLAAYGARDIGAVALAAAALRLGHVGLAVGVSAAVAAFLAAPHFCLSALFSAMLLIAMSVIADPRRLLRARGHLVFAVALLLAYPLMRDPGGAQTAVAWLLCIGFVVTVALNRPDAAGSVDCARRHWQYDASCLTALSLIAAFAAVAFGGLRLDSGQPPIFTPAMRDIWDAVRRLTPRDALVFTDQTGNTNSRIGGWNDYAMSAQRQFFIASWSTHRLRVEPAARLARLKENEEVLAGRLMPTELPLSRHYTSYYLVISAIRQPPPGAAAMYGNSEFALYRLKD